MAGLAGGNVLRSFIAAVAVFISSWLRALLRLPSDMETEGLGLYHNYNVLSTGLTSDMIMVIGY